MSHGDLDRNDLKQQIRDIVENLPEAFTAEACAIASRQLDRAIALAHRLEGHNPQSLIWLCDELEVDYDFDVTEGTLIEDAYDALRRFRKQDE